MTAERRPGPWKRLAYFAGGLLVLLALTLLAGGVWLRGEMLASLPRFDGEVVVPGMTGSVRIERDDLGVPTIHASDRLDLARATGFLHAQERFFQMDLLRRRSAGDLAELFGPGALDADRSVRIHRFRAIAEAYVKRAAAKDTLRFQAYSDGVNAGLAALDARPPEYLLLRSEPAPWGPEDCLLVFFSMYLDLQTSTGRRESDIGLVHELLPPELAHFLTPPGTEWDTPLIGEAFRTPGIPGPESHDLGAPSPEPAPPSQEAPVPGSNNWAVGGARTASGAGLLANDMHLGLGMPNIWYRASFVFSGTEERRITGVTLPGAPPMIVGSNGDVAWGFTNSQVDTSDLVIVEPDPADEERYLTPEGPLPFERYEERIRVHGAEDEILEAVWTIWGPIVGRDHRDRPRALRWVAHDVAGFDIGIDELLHARDVEQALAIANRSAIPTQNIVVAGRDGRIGWTLMGPVPHRVGHDGRRPSSWADGTRGWDGRLDPAEYPRLLDPPSGLLWTANNRVVSGRLLEKVGDGGYDLGARARQIRDGLRVLPEPARPKDLLAIQLDDRALFLERWRDLLLEILTDEVVERDPRRAELRRVVEESWSGRADVDSVGYRMVRAFRSFLADPVFETLTRPCREIDDGFSFRRIGLWEGALWKLIHERPAHLLDPRFASWDDQLVSGVDATLDYFLKDGATTLEGRDWGQRNTVRMRHPLTLAVPALARWLNPPPQRLPGDSHMPRVQSPGFGASERMVVSPGHEDEGLFHMPGGQSGHPFSPYYRKGHGAWARGEPSPFLPGPTVHELTLIGN